MKKIFLLAAILLSTQAQAVRLQCDLENISPTNATLKIFTLDINDKRVKVVSGYSGVHDLDFGEGLPITKSWEAGIVASNVFTETAKTLGASDNLTLNRHSLRLGLFTKTEESEYFAKGQCYESDPKF